MCNILFISHPKFSSGWDPSGSIKIFCSLTRFFFGVGSVGINQDLSLCDQISLRGGISYFNLDDFFLPAAASIKELFVSIRFFNILSMPQVFEQSLFLFCRGVEEFFFMCTWVKNGYRGGDVFGAIAWVKRGGEFFNIKKTYFLLLNKNNFFCHLLTVATTQFDWKKRHAQ